VNLQALRGRFKTLLAEETELGKLLGQYGRLTLDA
jgi:hypothetical protein